MLAELIYDGGETVNIPSTFKPAKEDQLQGTPAERLIEMAGRVCYDSTGSPNSRGSVAFHKNLAGIDGAPPHHSVHEHFHFTIETTLNPQPWLGIPDIAVRWLPASSSLPSSAALGKPNFKPERFRLTANLRHCFEWPNNVTYQAGGMTERLIESWGVILKHVLTLAMPNLVLPIEPYASMYKFVNPETDTEAYVSLFLEDSLVWSHEQVRHRFNISQRSGRFCDQTDRALCMHPLLRDYLKDTSGLLAEKCVLEDTIEESFEDQRLLYVTVVDKLQNWLIAKGKDKLTARKQARSAGRYYLAQGLSTEMLFTASIRNWRTIFKQRCNPAADAAIFELSKKAEELVRGSKYGYLL